MLLISPIPIDNSILIYYHSYMVIIYRVWELVREWCDPAYLDHDYMTVDCYKMGKIIERGDKS